MITSKRLVSELRAGKKTLRARPGLLLLGSTGARLWADYLEAAPGFVGRFDFIHKVNIPLLYTVKNSLVRSFEPISSEWYASHLYMKFANHQLSLEETKFITWDDCAVSCQTWTNHSQDSLTLQLETYEEAFKPQTANGLFGGFDIEHYSYDIDIAIAVSQPDLLREVVLKPGESKSFIIAAAAGIRGQDSFAVLWERAAQWVSHEKSVTEVVQLQQAAYEQWFGKAPTFQSSDPLLDRTWLYRWFLLRHNLADPRYGNLQHPLFYEGRSHKKSKKPFSKGGWEFSKLINLSVPLHLMDARWYHDSSYCEGSLQNMHESRDDEGMFACLMVDQVMHSFANFSIWAAYQLYLIHQNRAFMESVLPAFKHEVNGWQRRYGNENDHLMIEYRHTRTGKEYQPSYWYFHDYPRNPKDSSTYTHLKRVDRTVYHYLNVLGVAKLCDELGDPEAQHYYDWADHIKRDVLKKMWDEKSQFFYDLHYLTDEKAMVKNIVGFYPAWGQMIGDSYSGLIHHLFDPEEFNTGAPFPTTSADCPVYAKEGGWQGQFIKGRNGCMWNGPTWPYTNSIALDALASESKRNNHRFDKEFAYYLREYSYLHFYNRDLDQPGLVEHYNSSTGEPISDEQEYNHSYYIDLLIRHVAGLGVENNKIVLDPLDVGLDYFCLDNVNAAGRKMRITYKKAGIPAAIAPQEEGYRLYIDDKLVYSSEVLEKVELPLP